MTDIYTLGVKADTTDIDRGTDRIDDFADSAENADKKTGQFREGINTAGKAVATFGVTTATALGLVTVNAGNAAREISNLSRISGETVEGFQRAAFAAKTYGVEQDKLADILKDVQDKVGDFLTTGAGPMVDFFEKIAPRVGVTAENFRNLSGKDALQLYVSSIEKANVSQSEMVFYMEAIASDATLLQPLLANNGKEMLRLAERADNLGIVLDEIDVANLNDMKTVLSEMGAISEATANVIGATLAPFVTSLGEEFNAAAVNGDQLRDAMIDAVEVGVVVAGVYADAGRVFEIVGRSIGALAFTIAESNGNIEKHLDLSIALFVQWANSIDLALAEWVNAQDAELTRWATSVVNAVDVFDLFDDVVIKPQPLDTSGLEATADAMETRITELEESLVGSNESIENAWQDVVDLMSQPIPSEGFDAWFAALKKTVTAQRELQKAVKTTGAVNKEVVKDVSSDAGKHISSIKAITGAANAAFGENEAAAKALHKVNTVIAIAEQAMLVQKVIADNAATGSELANSAAKASANGLTAVTSAFAAPFPVSFVAGAAMIGIMASLLGGSGGGGSVSAPSVSEVRQETQGTGTVLGSSDKSASILDAQERFEDINIDQLAELRGIRSSMNAVADGIALVTRDLVATGALGTFDGALQNKQFTDSQVGNLVSDAVSVITGDFLATKDITNAIFGSTKTKVVDSGIQFVGETLGEIIDSGIVGASQFFDLETTKKKLFGIIKKTSNTTQLNDLDAVLTEQMGAIFGNIAGTVAESVAILGIGTRSEIDEALGGYAVELGKVSFEGLTGEEVQAELGAVFSQQADLITGFLTPSLKEYQQVGEGLFDTLTRVTFEQVMFNDSMAAMGVSLADLSAIMQVDVAQSVIGLIGGVEEFADATNAFIDGFFSEAEKTKMLGDSLADVFEQLGTPMTTTREGFRALVEGMDLTTEAGRQMFATLLELTPAMDDYLGALEDNAAAEAADEEQRLNDIRNAAIREAADEEQRLSDIRNAAAREEAEATREVAAAMREAASRAKELERAVNSALSDLSKAVSAEQKILDAALSDSVSGIESTFETRRSAAIEQTEAQVSLMERQLGIVNGNVSALYSLSDILTGSLITLNGISRATARNQVHGAISRATAGQSLAGVDLQGAISALTNVDQNQFGSAVEFQQEKARTSAELKTLSQLTDGQLSQAEQNAVLLESQTETIQTIGENQITALEEVRDAQIATANEQFDRDSDALAAVIGAAQQQLDVLTGIDSGIKSLVDAQEGFVSSMVTALVEQQRQGVITGEQLEASLLGLANMNSTAIDGLSRDNTVTGVNLADWLANLSGLDVATRDVLAQGIGSLEDAGEVTGASLEGEIIRLTTENTKVNGVTSEAVVSLKDDNAEWLRLVFGSTATTTNMVRTQTNVTNNLLQNNLPDIKRILQDMYNNQVAATVAVLSSDRIIRRWDGSGMPAVRNVS